VKDLLQASLLIFLAFVIMIGAPIAAGILGALAGPVIGIVILYFVIKEYNQEPESEE
jgi:predicted PurR-regulated permease PerM